MEILPLESIEREYRESQAILLIQCEEQRLFYYVYIRALIDLTDSNARVRTSATEWFLSNAKSPPSKCNNFINFIWCVEQFTPDAKTLIKKTRRIVKAGYKTRVRFLRKFNYFTTANL